MDDVRRKALKHELKRDAMQNKIIYALSSDSDRSNYDDAGFRKTRKKKKKTKRKRDVDEMPKQLCDANELITQ
jgi:hypothetical protein